MLQIVIVDRSETGLVRAVVKAYGNKISKRRKGV